MALQVLLLWCTFLCVVTISIAEPQSPNTTTTAEPVYEHLGCFLDSATSPDLSGLVTELQQPSSGACVQQCAASGYPFAGLQEEQFCFCGVTFGQYGKSSDSAACNFTCGPSDDPCGGSLANDVYYTINTETSANEKRKLVVMTSPRSHANARRGCVALDGDLAPITSLQQINDTLQLLGNASPAGTTFTNVWIGLSRPSSAAAYQWNYLGAEQLFTMIDFISFWKSGEQFAGNCVSLMTSSGKWQSTPCDITLPYVCIATVSPTLANSETTVGSSEVTQLPVDVFGQKQYILYIVLSIMMTLFITSCAAYGVHRLRLGDRKSVIRSKVMTTYPSATFPNSENGSKSPPAGSSQLGNAFATSASGAAPAMAAGEGQGKASTGGSLSVQPVIKRVEAAHMPEYLAPGRVGYYARNSLTSVESSDDLLGVSQEPCSSRGRSLSFALPHTTRGTDSSGPLELGVHFPGMTDRRRSHQDNQLRRNSLRIESDGPCKSSSTNCLLPSEDNRLAPDYSRRASRDFRRPSRDARRASLHPRHPDDPDLGQITALRRSSVAPAKLKKKRIIIID